MIFRVSMRWHNTPLALAAFLATVSCRASSPDTATANTFDAPAVGTAGMVSSGHPLATDAGLRILEAGGNAFDASVAVAAMLNVVEPMMSGIGGYGTILVYEAASNATWFLNPSGRIPAAVNSDVYRAPTPDYRQNRRGAKAVSTPGNVNAWEAMSKQGAAPKHIPGWDPYDKDPQFSRQVPEDYQSLAPLALYDGKAESLLVGANGKVWQFRAQVAADAG